jgi:hypothetical protein
MDIPVRSLFAGFLVSCLVMFAAWAVAAGPTAPTPMPAPTPASAPGGKKKIVFIPGPPSHGYGDHAHGAGCALLAKLLNENVPAVQAVVSKGGWPKDASVLEGADAIVLSCDGGGLVTAHLAELDALMKKGVGLACLHYTLDVPKAKAGKQMLEWIGGYYEQFWSVNPTWEADFKTLGDHPIARGVKPFRIQDEWYYHMRFVEDMKGVTPILTAVPPDSTRKGRDGAHSGNAEVRARIGLPEHLAWAYERPDGGRGFGFTGLHTYWYMAHNGYRTILLNAMVWIAKAEVPAAGVPSKTPTVEEMEANLATSRPANWKPERVQKMIEQFNR